LLERPLGTTINGTEKTNLVSSIGNEWGISAFDIIGKILGISGLVYAVGLVSVNISYWFWGFHDLEVPYQQCIYAGFLAFGVRCIGLPSSRLDQSSFQHIADKC